jgi:hypothetical protein
MTTQTLPAAAKSSYTISGLTGGLASATYAASSAVDLSATDPLDIIVEVSVTTGSTPAGNKQILVFVKTSLDNSLFSSGPESGTTVTDQPDLYQIGVIPAITASTVYTGHFSVAQALGWVPPYHKLVVFNDNTGANGAVTSASTASYTTVTGASA